MQQFKGARNEERARLYAKALAGPGLSLIYYFSAGGVTGDTFGQRKQAVVDSGPLTSIQGKSTAQRVLMPFSR